MVILIFFFYIGVMSLAGWGAVFPGRSRYTNCLHKIQQEGAIGVISQFGERNVDSKYCCRCRYTNLLGLINTILPVKIVCMHTIIMHHAVLSSVSINFEFCFTAVMIHIY